MTIKLFNTMTRSKQEFVPLEPGKARMYCCGLTVYNYAHIGNLRTYIFEDVLRRVLLFNGYDLLHVQNVTDVGHMTTDADAGEDKMQKASQREQKSPWEIARFYEEAAIRDFDRLNIEHTRNDAPRHRTYRGDDRPDSASGSERLYLPDDRRRVFRHGEVPGLRQVRAPAI